MFVKIHLGIETEKGNVDCFRITKNQITKLFLIFNQFLVVEPKTTKLRFGDNLNVQSIKLNVNPSQLAVINTIDVLSEIVMNIQLRLPLNVHLEHILRSVQ